MPAVRGRGATIRAKTPRPLPRTTPLQTTMATDLRFSEGLPQLADLEPLRKRWGWVVGLGVALIVLGALALGSSVLMTLATVVFVGWLMIVGGVLEAFHA